MKKSTLVVSVAMALGATAVLAQTPGYSTPAAAAAPASIDVPKGHKAVMTQVGAGDLTYECKEKADKSGYEWTFAGPNAVLYGSDKKPAGKYYGGPTWESNDGSKVTGKQLAVVPGAAGAIPHQLVQANPATGEGSMKGVTYIQRVNTQGGVAPKDAPCAAKNAGEKKTVKYQADYVFYKQQ